MNHLTDPAQGLPSDKRLFTVELKKHFPLKVSIMDTISRRPRRVVHAVNGVDLSIRDTEILGLVGESGCGKTTLARTLAGLLSPTDGRIFYRPSEKTMDDLKLKGVTDDGGFVELTGLEKEALLTVRREIGMIFQDPYGAFDPRYKVKTILEEPLDAHRVPSDTWLETIRVVLEDVKLVPVEDFMHRYPHMLSGGQRQRLGVARALVLDPKMLIADEPVSMLDVSIRAEVLELLLEQRDKRGLSCILITHDLAVARYVCDRIVVMYLGKVMEEGVTDTIIKNPSHPYSLALISAVPTPEPDNRGRLFNVPIYGEIPSPVNIPEGCRFNPRCTYAADKCRRDEPPLISIGDGRRSSCWFAEDILSKKVGGARSVSA